MVKSVKAKVRNAHRVSIRISSKRRVTIPGSVLRQSGLGVGDRLTARSDGAGRIVLQREFDVVAEFAAALTGVYERAELDALRSEWD